MLGILLICTSTHSISHAEEIPTDVLSEPVTDARDSKDKLNEVLNKASDPVTSPEFVNDDLAPDETDLDTIVEYKEPVDTEDDSSEVGISSNEATEEEPVTEDPTETTPEIPVEKPEDGSDELDDENEGITPEEPFDDKNGDSAPGEESENTPTPPADIKDLDDKLQDALKPIEMPEEDTTVEEQVVMESRATVKNEEKKVTKYNIDRLPETGIAEDIELIYIFEIIILGFALLMLSFRPIKKSRHRK